jgi:nucleoside-diphosphate-sugar epimerase
MKGKNKVLVTGAPGWLGTRLVELLCSKGYDTRCFVLNKGIDLSPIKKFNIEIIEGDITKKETITDAVKNIDTVVHCIGLIHPKKINDLYKINTQGTKNILEKSVESNVKKFIYISSNSAQGCNIKREVLMKESDKERPEKNYGKSKYMAERVVRTFQNTGKINTVILRPCWFYGPGQPERQTRLMKMIKSGRPLIFGDGKNLRSMSYIDNIIDAIILAMNKDIANGKTYWIADKKPYETIEIYNIIADILGVKIKPHFVPKIVSLSLDIADDILQAIGLYIQEVHVGGELIRDIACDISKAQKELGYNPKIGLREGMKRSVEWAKKHGVLND